MAHRVDPGRVIDEALEYFTGLDDVLQVDPVYLAVRLGIDLADPLRGIWLWRGVGLDLCGIQRRQGIDPGIDCGDVIAVEGCGDDHVATQIEQILFHGFHCPAP